MTSQEKGRPLPKFGEWDVNNPSSAEGFSVIFARARDEKRGIGSSAAAKGGAPPPPPQKNDNNTHQSSSNTYRILSRKKRCCCF